MLPASTLITLAIAACAAVITRPRFYDWERIGQRGRPAVVAGSAAMIGIVASLAPVLGPLVRWPDDLARAWVLADSIALACAVFIFAVLVTPFLAGGVVAIAFIAHGIAYNLRAIPDGLSVLSGARNEVSWLAVTALLGLTLVVHISTYGATSFSRRLGSNET